MFGISLGKLLLLVALGAAGWFMWRRMTRKPAPPTAQAPPARRQDAGSAEVMAKCARCGAYVAESAGRCDRADCPRPA